MIAALAVALVAVAIVKPWSAAGPSTPDGIAALPTPARAAVEAALVAPADSWSRPDARETGGVIAGLERARLLPGQVECGTSDWRIVTLGEFGRWTVRTWIAITPAEAAGPGDTSIPEVSLGESDVAGMGACAPSTASGAPGRASRIVQAWRTVVGGASTSALERVTLAQLDPLASGGPAAARSLTPKSVTELFRPVPAVARGRWPAGRYVLLLASPDASADRWIAVEIAGARR